MHLTGGMTLQFEKLVPACHRRTLTYRDAELAQDGSIDALGLHAHGHIIDAWHVFALNHTFEIDITERCHLLTHAIRQVLLGTEHEHIGLNTHTLHLLDRMLSRLGLKFVGSLEIRHIGEMHAHRLVAKFPAKLTDGLKEWSTLDVANRTANLGDDEVELIIIAPHSMLDLVGDVRNHLNGLAKIVATTLTVDDGLVDPASSDRIVARCADASETLIVAKVEVGLHAIDSHIALTMLVWVERTRVDVDIWVELLYCDFVASCLKQHTDARRNNAFTEGGNHTSCYKDISCHSNIYYQLLINKS